MEKHCESAKRFGKEGNGKAAKKKILESFIRDSSNKAYQFAYGLAGNRAEAQELVQEGLYRVMLASERFDLSKPLESWFFTIVRNAFMDSRRRYERRNGISLDCPVDGVPETNYGDVLVENGEGLPEALERMESVKLARRALTRISEEQREVLTLSDMNGLNYVEIAEKLGLPLGTVRSRIHRARQAFRGVLSASEAVA